MINRLIILVVIILNIAIFSPLILKSLDQDLSYESLSEKNSEQLKIYLDDQWTTYTFDDGPRYYGDWDGDNRDGFGVYEWDGNYYIGWWKWDQFYSKGKHIFYYGEVYEGQYERGDRHGQGTKTYVNGDRYEGEWAYGRYEGQGIKTYANGDRYEGEWAYGRYDGQGIKTYANGDRYEGGWAASNYQRLLDTGHYEGQGTLTLAAGKFEGLWSYDDALEMHVLDNENDLLSKFENRSFKGFEKKKKQISNFGKTKGENIYVNACGYDPQSYSLTPLDIEGAITEVPNTVYSVSKSPYGRPIIVGAQSEMELPNKKKFTAILQNFRDFSIIDEFGEVLQHKVSGASSIYEIKKHGKVVGWGVGWDRGCDPYNYITFTAFRIFIPYWNEDDFGIDERLIQANANDYLNAYNESDDLILIDTDTIPGDYHAVFCYYCAVNFLKIDNIHGITDLNSIEDLYKHNIDLYKINPLLAAYWYGMTLLKQENIVEPLPQYKRYIDKNYKIIIKDAVENFYFSESLSENYLFTDSPAGKIAPFFRRWERYYPQNIIINRLIMHYEENCDIQSLNSIKEIANECFPAHAALMYDIYSDYMSPIEGLLDTKMKEMDF